MDFDVPFSGEISPEFAWKDYISLIEAIRNGNEFLVQHLVESGAPVNYYRSDCLIHTPLHLAIQSRSTKIAEILLNSGADMNAKNVVGETPLILAAKMEITPLIDLLLSFDVCYQEDRDHFSHLHIASMRSNVEIVRKLLTVDQRQIINKPVRQTSMFWQGYTPLHFAVHYGSTEMAEFLLKCGADMMIQDSRGLTPLHLADLQRNERMIDLLLSAHKHEFKNPVSPSGLTHFHIACTRNDASVVEHFLKLGVDINNPICLQADGPWARWKPIHFAMYYDCPKVIDLLLLAGANLGCAQSTLLLTNKLVMRHEPIYNLFIDRTNDQYESCTKDFKMASNLDAACIQDDLKMIEELVHELKINAPSDFDQTTWFGGSPLHLTIKCGSTEVATFLLDHGAGTMIQDNHHRTPLHMAFHCEHMDILESIIEKFDKNTRNLIDNDGLSIFHILCTTDHLQTVQNFISSGVDVNAQVLDTSELWAGFTPLHFACMHLQSEVVELLLSHHADVNVKNRLDLNPLDLVIEKLIPNLPLNEEILFNVLHIFFSSLSPVVCKQLQTQGITPLHIFSAVELVEPENLDRIREYLKANEDQINNTIELHRRHEFHKCTPLHVAMMYSEFEIAKLLVEHGADLFVINSEGRTPLEEYAHYHEARLEDLIRYATLLSVRKANQTPRSSHFHLACAVGNLDVVTHVLDTSDEETKKILISSRDSRGRAILHSLSERRSYVWSEREQILRLLLENGADVNVRDYQLRTPLHYASCHRVLNESRLLIDYGANVNARDKNGLTPLLDTSYSVDDIVFLLENGADINVTSEEGKTRLMKMLYLSDDGIWTTFDVYLDAEKKCIIAMLKHVKKLQLVGWYVSDRNREAYAKLLQSVERDFDEATFVDDCEREFESMVLVRIDRYTTLRCILSKTLNEMASHCENVDLRIMIDSSEFLKKFPIFGPFVKLQMKNGDTRRSLLVKLDKCLNSVIGVSLPQVCSNMILQYLSNADLENIISAVRE